MFPTQQTIDRDRLNEIHTGDALLVKSKTGWLSRLIRYMSGSAFVHSAIAVRIDSNLYVIESKFSSRYSYQMMPIDWWLARHPNEELFIGRMPNSNRTRYTGTRIRRIVLDAMESLRSYELSWLAVVYIVQEWFGRSRPDLSRWFTRRPLICSTLVQEAWERAGLIPIGSYMTPGGLVDMLGGESALIPMNIGQQSDISMFPEPSNDAQMELLCPSVA